MRRIWSRSRGAAKGSASNPQMRPTKSTLPTRWSTTIPPTRSGAIDIELSHHPEYRKFRMLAKQIAKVNASALTVTKNEHKDVLPNWRDLLEHMKAEGKRDASVQRYKGLGEMNAEQLADTTMDPEKRTLLSVRLEDLVGDRSDFHHSDGRGCGESPPVHRRQRARR